MFINPEIDTQRLAKGTKVEELSATYKALFNLTQPIERDRLGFLTREQEAELKTIITTKQPNEVGFDCYIWTAKVISAYVKREFNIDYKPISIYDVLERLHLSHQRAHEDYSNADKEEQKEFIENLKKKEETTTADEKIVAYDEFSVLDKPSIYYAWAETNTRPQVPCNQAKKRTRLNGFIGIDIKTGDEYLKFSPSAKSEDIAQYFLELSIEAIREERKKLCIILDNAKTHKEKMQKLFFEMLKIKKLEDKISVTFMHTARYSPKLNVAEYAIHLIRLKFFHHLPDYMTWESIIQRIKTYLQENQIFTKEQVKNTLHHIYSLVI